MEKSQIVERAKAIERNKALRGSPKHLAGTGQLAGFTYLMINLPFECNYRCQKCFNMENNKANPYNCKISLEDRIGLIDEARSLGAKVVAIAGEGEPAISTEIRPLVEKIRALKMIPIIYSNGSTMTKKNARFFLENNASIMISFDTLDPEKYHGLTGTTGIFGNVIKNVKSAIEIYKEGIEETKSMRILGIGINSTVSSANENEIAEIKRFWGEDVYFVCNPLARLGNAVGNWESLNSNEDCAKRQKLIRELSESGGPLTLGKDGLCGYSAWGVCVGPNGDYMTCAYTTKTNGMLGNIKDTSLKDAFERKHGMEFAHYEKYGTAPCLVRKESFGKYLETLNRAKK